MAPVLKVDAAKHQAVLLVSQLTDSYVLLTGAGRKNNELEKESENGKRCEVNVEFSVL